MFQKKKSHKGFVCGMLFAVAATGAIIFFMTKTSKGRQIRKKAKNIAGEVEELVKSELCC
ncbi:MAG: hypothetical protein IJV96_02475 [Clostridia bacterium]|nr:hypothetical protein [Clostridia bacterium]